MAVTFDVDVPARELSQLGPLIGADRFAQFSDASARTAAILRGRVVWNVNSTATGGGVAEMLQLVLGYLRGADVDVRWAVLSGDHGFFEITKRLHNRLHGWMGDGGELGATETAHYCDIMRENAAALRDELRSGDVVVLHDPQTVGLAGELAAQGVRVVWCCHIGADGQNQWTEDAWSFLRPQLRDVEAVVVSRRGHVPPGVEGTRTFVIPPAIDPFSPKNHDLGADTVAALIARIGVAAGPAADAVTVRRPDGSTFAVRRHGTVVADGPFRSSDEPMVVQVSRWDRLKDMAGVLHGFAAIASDVPGRLVLAGPEVAGVADDPEAAHVLDECIRSRASLPAAVRSRTALVTLPMDDVEENAVMVNALQRHAAVVMQKSLAEGFGLTVAEAMWKGRAVIGAAVGGIKDQILEGTGVLVDPRDVAGFGGALRHLLNDDSERHRLGRAAQQRVIREYLPDRQLLQYGDLFARLLRNGDA